VIFAVLDVQLRCL